MTTYHFHCAPRRLAIAMTLVVFFGTLASAFGQPVLLPSPEPLRTPAGTGLVSNLNLDTEKVLVDGNASESGTCSLSPNGGCCGIDYWIVSSRNCPRPASRGKCCPGCRLRYVHMVDGTCTRGAGMQGFLQSLKQGVPVCIIIHGSFANRKDVIHGSRKMYEWLRAPEPGRPMQFVFFTWPSDTPSTLLLQVNVAILGRRSARHGYHLAQLISAIPIDNPVSLLGHSHGARTVASAVHLLGGGHVQGLHLACPPSSDQRIRIVLAAAAIDNHWLNPGERYGRAICRAEALLHLRNHRDRVLALYRFRRPFSRPALVRTGFTRSSLQAMGAHASKVAEYDVSRLVGGGHFWQHYFRSSELAHAIAPTIYYLDDVRSSPVEYQPSTETLIRHGVNRPISSRSKAAPVRETFSNFGRVVFSSRS